MDEGSPRCGLETRYRICESVTSSENYHLVFHHVAESILVTSCSRVEIRIDEEKRLDVSR